MMRITFPFWTKRHIFASVITLGWCLALYFGEWVDHDMGKFGIVTPVLSLVTILWADWGALSLSHGWMESRASNAGDSAKLGPVVEFMGWLALLGSIALVYWQIKV